MGYVVKFEYQEAYSEVSVWDDGNTATLSVVFSKFRRRGAGRFVLEKAMQYADALKVDLFLEIVPFGENPGMDDKALKAFYMSLGFISQGSNVMLRPYANVSEQENL